MQEFENLAYFDLQKTGSTTIKSALKRTLDEERIYRSVHDGPREGYDRSKPSFISIREPLSIYLSLFNFATMERRGNLYDAMRRSGHVDLYAPSAEAFEPWLAFVLDPKNAASLKRDYARYAPCGVVGLLSFRLLFISLPDTLERMERGRFRDKDAIRELLARHFWRDHVRAENLGGDLFAFLKRNESRLRLRRELGTEEEFAARLPVRNVSGKIPGLVRSAVSAELQRRVREREWLFYETFGYDTDPKGRAPS